MNPLTLRTRYAGPATALLNNVPAPGWNVVRTAVLLVLRLMKAYLTLSPCTAMPKRPHALLQTLSDAIKRLLVR